MLNSWRARSSVQVFLRFLELAAVEMQPCDIEVADRFLRQLLVGLVIAKDSLEPFQASPKSPRNPGASARLCVTRRT